MTQQPLPSPPLQTPAKASGLAIASLVVGILSIIPLLGIVALILGLIALSAISKSAGRLSGKGLAVAGVVLGAGGVAWTLLVAFLAVILIPIFSTVRGVTHIGTCHENLRQVGQALMIYRSKHDGQFPPDLTAAFEAHPGLRGPALAPAFSLSGSRRLRTAA